MTTKTINEWKQPLLRILDKFDQLDEERSNFSNLTEREVHNNTPLTAIPVAVVAVAVSVAIAVQPAVVAAANEELLHAKLLDVLDSEERTALLDAVSFVRSNPSIIKETLGENFGSNFFNRLENVERSLSI
jgi:hypothetical protein